MASPAVAGAVALYLQRHPGAAPATVFAALQKAAVEESFESRSPALLLNVLPARLDTFPPAPVVASPPPPSPPPPAPVKPAPAAPAVSSPFFWSWWPWVSTSPWFVSDVADSSPSAQLDVPPAVSEAPLHLFASSV